MRSIRPARPDASGQPAPTRPAAVSSGATPSAPAVAPSATTRETGSEEASNRGHGTDGRESMLFGSVLAAVIVLAGV